MLVLVALLLTCVPERADVEDWLGTYTSGPETIAFRWEDGLVYDHGNIAIPVDGEWHVTVPEFYVRHRINWIADRGVLRLDESHDESTPGRHEFRLDDNRIMKVSLTDGEGEVVVRVFERSES